MRNFFKEKKAITLIALVITIVVLIILAGVLINISLGNNRLFNKAKTAKELYANAQEYEETEIAKMTNNIDNYVGFSRTGGSNISYSTSEQEIGTWVDGKTIYQQVFLNISFTGGEDTKLVSLTDPIDQLIDIKYLRHTYNGVQGKRALMPSRIADLWCDNGTDIYGYTTLTYTSIGTLVVQYTKAATAN